MGCFAPQVFDYFDENNICCDATIIAHATLYLKYLRRSFHAFSLKTAPQV
jgi:hypothetical protein